MTDDYATKRSDYCNGPRGCITGHWNDYIWLDGIYEKCSNCLYDSCDLDKLDEYISYVISSNYRWNIETYGDCDNRYFKDG